MNKYFIVVKIIALKWKKNIFDIFSIKYILKKKKKN